jgi:hypothetical protein
MWLALIDAMMRLMSAWIIETGRSKNAAQNACRKVAFWGSKSGFLGLKSGFLVLSDGFFVQI